MRLTRRERQDPWQHAVVAEREYITPEDIGEAIKAGAARFAIYQATLEAIQLKRAEDPTLCAYVAVHSREWRIKATPKRSNG